MLRSAWKWGGYPILCDHIIFRVFNSNFAKPPQIWWEELPVWLPTIKSLKLHISHFLAGKSQDGRVHETVLEIWDQFWIAIVNRKFLVCKQGGAENIDATKNTKRWRKCFKTLCKNTLQKRFSRKNWTINVSSTSPQRSHWLKRVFPPNRHPRPRPSLSFASTAALASRSRSTTKSWPLTAAWCSGVRPREARA